MTKLLFIITLLFSVSVFASGNTLSQEEIKLDDEVLTIIDAEDTVSEEELVKLNDSLDSQIDSIEL